MIEWSKQTMNDVSLGIFDGPHATPKPSDTGPVFLGIKNITEDGHFDLEKIRHISEEEYPKWTKRVTPQKGDVVFTYEATLNRYAVIPENFKCCLGRRMALIRPDTSKVDTDFLFYYFFTPEWREVIRENTISGSTVDRIPLTYFPEYKIRLPELEYQRRVSNVIHEYTSLINNNNSRIKILEEMARTIYTEWFVNFRFPGHAEVKLIDSKTDYGKIPSGWKVTQIGGQVKIPKGKNITRKTLQDGAVPVVAGGLKPAYHHAESNTQSPVVTISASGANSGYVNLYLEDVWASDCSYIDLSVTPHVYFYYLLLKTRQHEVTHLQRGSAQPHVYPKDVMGLSMVIPADDVLDTFSELVTSLFDLIRKLQLQVNNLTETRDLLIPKLVTGEIEIKT